MLPRTPLAALTLAQCLLGAAVLAVAAPTHAQNPPAPASAPPAALAAPPQPARVVFPPWAEATGVSPADPPGIQEFDAGGGALPQLSAPTFGPSSGLCVNLATGVETYVPVADIIVHNATGSDVAFIRSYRSDLALKGISSAGLSAGWVNNFNVVIVSPKPAWGDIFLVYPSGARDMLHPEVGPDGKPTGKFATGGGKPFLVQGTPSPTTPGRWESVVVSWTNGARWEFKAVADNACALLHLDDLTFSWLGPNRLSSVFGGRDNKMLLNLTYDAQGNLQAATDLFGRHILYSFATPPAGSGLTAPCLITVSQLAGPTDAPPPPLHYYGYIAQNGKPLLHTVTVPSPAGQGFSTATIQYDATGKVQTHVDATGVQHIFTYGATGTRVEIREASGALTQYSIQNIDSLGRNIGITDANGNSTKLIYGK